MNTRGLAYINHGRWMVDCPKCGAPNLFNPESGNRAVCGVCYPDILAVMFVKRDGKEAFSAIPDHERREEARNNAESFEVTVPLDWREILETLRPRSTDKMNWLPGETMASLNAENESHGIWRVK